VVRCNDFDLNGNGTQAEWQKAQWVSLHKLSGQSNKKTQFKIMASWVGVYCLYDCEDDKITATMQGQNLDLYFEDVIEAFLWSDLRYPVYFEYELSPLNCELAIMVPNYDGDLEGWVPWHYTGKRLARHAVSIHTDPCDTTKVTGWSGEFFIPFKLLEYSVKTPPVKGTIWRANFFRMDHDNGLDRWAWMPVESSFHEYWNFGTLIFD
jgi:hypothetical protein